MKRTKVLILIPDGIGIKNYLYSNVFKDDSLDITLFHNFEVETIDYLKQFVNFEDSFLIPPYNESIKEKFLRELIHSSRLKLNAKKVQNSTILKFRKSSHKSLKLKVFFGLVNLSSEFVKSYDSVLKLEANYNIALRKNSFYNSVSDILRKYKPDVIFCTHQRALKAPTIFVAAKDLGIKTTTVIYSWDNIPKARLALRADNYLVWSKYMKKELGVFYPEISAKTIKITGTPQFEFYNDPSNIIEKDTFYSTYNLNINKNMICFSGDDIKTSPYDPQYLNDVATAIINADKEKEYQLIFRRSPVDVSGRYNWVLKKFPNLIVEMPPLWNCNSEKWSNIFPTYGDIKLLVSLAFYSDVVINVGSTMAFDFGMFKKPCIYINYDSVEDLKWSVNTIYNYQHFRSMPSKKAVFWFNNSSEIAIVIKKALEHPSTEIEKWMGVVVGQHKNASENILKRLI